MKFQSRWKLSSFGLRKTLERLVAGDESEITMLETTALGAIGEAVVIDRAGPDVVDTLRFAARAGVRCGCSSIRMALLPR